MEYIQGISSQTALFFLSLGFGFLLGVLYDVFRTVRLIVSGGERFVFVMDFLYFAACGVLSFFFLLVTDEGRLRIYTLAGEMLGWMIYYFSFGAVAVRVTSAVARLFRRMFSSLLSAGNFVFRKIVAPFEKLFVFLRKRIKKSDKKTKYILQKQKGIVYNLYSYFYKCNLFNNKGK